MSDENIFHDEIAPDCEKRHGFWLAEAREHATRIAREKGRVTIDDVRLVCPPPKYADPRVMGAVLKQPHFTHIGWRRSTRAKCHGRHIGIFTLTD